MTFTAAPDERAEALAALRAARAHAEALRRLVAEGRAGASSLHAAEYALHGCLERARRCGVLDPDDEPEPTS